MTRTEKASNLARDPRLSVHPPGLEPGTHWLKDWPAIPMLSDYRERRESAPLVEDREAIVTQLGASA